VSRGLGRFFAPADAGRGAAPVVVLSGSAWRRRCGADPGVLGRPIVLSGQPHTIVGVLPRTFVFPPRADPEVWLPFRPSPAQESRHYMHFLSVLASRRADVSAQAAADDVRAVGNAWQKSGDAWHKS